MGKNIFQTVSKGVNVTAIFDDPVTIVNGQGDESLCLSDGIAEYFLRTFIQQTTTACALSQHAHG